MSREIKFRTWDGWRLEQNPLVKLDMYGVPWVDRGECGEKPVDWLVMQYTGLKDKNGKEIYEGDIVYIAGLGNCLVKWDYGGACWMFESKDEDAEYHFVMEDLESITGNIYESPELLEGEE